MTNAAELAYILAGGEATRKSTLRDRMAEGIREQMIHDGTLATEETGAVCQVAEEGPYPEDGGDECQCWGDISGEVLPAEEAKKARIEELTFIEGKPLYDMVSIRECYEATGAAPISTKWLNGRSKR